MSISFYKSFNGEWSGGRISWDWNSTFSWGQIIFDHEIKFFGTFHEVKIPNNYSISWSQHFSWDQKCLIMLFRILISWLFLRLTNQSWDWNSKLVSCTCGSFLALIISYLCIKTFDLMIVLAANESTMRSKLPTNALSWFQSCDQSVNLLIKTVKY